MSYIEFLNKKASTTFNIGFSISEMKLNHNLFDFQKYIVKKALSVGRFAIFADCGLGKTLMQLEIAKQCAIKTKKPSIILTPIAVVEQTILEGSKFDITATYIDENGQSQITNYEQLKNIDASKYGCVCLDESSILKNFQGKIKKQLIDMFKKTEYRFCFTATPSPNDTMELGNHAEFLGQMKYKNMLSMYFINDMDTVQKWRLKKHAEDTFWKWISSWSVCLTKPSDIGFEDKGYVLPKLNLIERKLETEKLSNSSLFNTISVNSTNHNRELRRTFDVRMQETIDIANSTNEPVIVWVKHNEESSYLAKNINGAREVTGTMNDIEKKKLLLGFAKGEFRVLVTKTKIAQYGLNYQHCNIQIFPSLDFSFEGTYQAIRRSYRFGQKREVSIYLITTDTMQNVIESIRRKEAQFVEMKEKIKSYAA